MLNKKSIKTTISSLTATALLASMSFASIPAFAANDDVSIKVAGVTTNANGTKVYDWFDQYYTGYCSGGSAAKVIDVTEDNGDINWNQVRGTAEIDGAIIRCGYGEGAYDEFNKKWTQDDSKWATNIKGALKANLSVGVSIYSTAITKNQADKEADHVLRCLEDQDIKPGDLKLPIFYVVTDPTIANTNLEYNFKTFADKIQQAGYAAGILATANQWNTTLTSTTFDNYVKWVAQWDGTTGLTCERFKNFATGRNMWQFSNMGAVAGISTPTNLTYTYMSAAYGVNAAPGEQLVANGTYEIVAHNTDYCLDVKNGSKADRANIQLYKRNFTKAQRFYISYDGDGFYTITNANSGSTLDVRSASTANGANIWQFSANYSDAQKWRIDENADGTYTFTSKCNNKVIDVASAKYKNGTNIQCWTSNGTPAQKFKLERLDTTPGTQTIPSGIYTIQSKIDSNNNKYMLDVAGGYTSNGTNVQIYKSNGTTSQQFRLTYDGEGYYTVTSVRANKAVDVFRASTINGGNIHIYTSNKTDAQKWRIDVNDDGTYTFVSKCNNKALDVANGVGNNGQNVQIYEQNGSPAQKWILTAAK